MGLSYLRYAKKCVCETVKINSLVFPVCVSSDRQEIFFYMNILISCRKCIENEKYLEIRVGKEYDIWMVLRMYIRMN
jgi:hypothetical protein